MSDCTQGGRRAYNAPTHTPDEDALTITAHFKDGSERPCTMNRMGRTLDYLEVDGERYERVGECEMIEDSPDALGEQGSELYPCYKAKCSSCGALLWEVNPMNYCSNCGARVKEADA